MFHVEIFIDEKFLKNKNIKYQGGDIVEELVEELKTNMRVVIINFLVLI